MVGGGLGYPTDAHNSNANYLEYQYNLSLPPDEDAYYKSTHQLLRELISQRLSQRFQIILSDSSDGSDKQNFYFSRGNQYHKLTFQPENQNIVVKRYTRRWSTTLKPQPYKYLLWNVTDESHIAVQANIPVKATASEMFNWNYQDQLVAGFIDSIIDEDMPDFVQQAHFKVLHFAVIPSAATDSLDELRTNFSKFKECLAGGSIKNIQRKGDMSVAFAGSSHKPGSQAVRSVELRLPSKNDRYEWIVSGEREGEEGRWGILLTQTSSRPADCPVPDAPLLGHCVPL